MLIDEKYLIIKSNFLWAHYLSKKNLLLKIPFKQINKISRENGVMVTFTNENNDQQFLRIHSIESERLVETLLQQINHEQ